MKPHLVPVETSGSSPFDAIKNTSPDGAEYWSARDLMPLLGYDKWERFDGRIQEAMRAAAIAGVQDQFPGAGKMVTLGSGSTREVRDYHLTRYACYMVAMSCDGRKPEVAAAKTYFAVRTREAEIRPAVQALPRDYASALREAADQYERAELAAARVRELEAPARSWEALAAPGGDYSVSAAAKVLSRDANIEIGRDRLFRHMYQLGWIFRTTGHRAHWEASQDRAIRTGRLVHKLGGGFINEKTGKWEQAHPTVRVTPKGLGELHKSLGGSGQLEIG